MTLCSFRLLSLAFAAAACLGFWRVATAQSHPAYPARPVHVVVGFPPGGPADLFVRFVGQRLAERLGQPFLVENRPGAAGNVATEMVVRAAPDGYTLLQLGPPHAINAALYDKLSFDFVRDIAPVANIARSPNVLVVTASLPAKSVEEFIAYAKANPGKVNMASSGSGTVTHVSGELFKMMTGVMLVHVPYRGSSPALADLVGGQAQAMFDNLPSSIGFIRSGKLRALAVTTAARSVQLPDTPSVAEYLPGYEASSWFGLGGPKAMPEEVVQTLNREVNEALADPAIKAKIVALGAATVPGSAAEFGRFIAEETEKWAKVVKFSGAKPD